MAGGLSRWQSMRHPVLLQPEPGVRLRLGSRDVEYRVRRSARSRGLRVTIDPRAGVLVSVPPATRRGWAHPEPRIEAFLRERASWVVRHLERLERDREAAAARGGARDGGLVPFHGELHRITISGGRATGPSTVTAVAGPDGPTLVVHLRAGERRTLDRVLTAWLRESARSAIDRAVARHAAALGVRPVKVDLRDPKSRWGSASRNSRLMFSWRLILAPPASLETVVVHELAHLRVFGHGPGFWALVARLRPDHLADRAWLRRNTYAIHAALEQPKP
jgi:predicted metal-dependent hydrolase